MNAKELAEFWVRFTENRPGIWNIHTWFDSKGWDDEFCEQVREEVLRIESEAANAKT